MPGRHQRAAQPGSAVSRQGDTCLYRQQLLRHRRRATQRGAAARGVAQRLGRRPQDRRPRGVPRAQQPRCRHQRYRHHPDDGAGEERPLERRNVHLQYRTAAAASAVGGDGLWRERLPGACPGPQERQSPLPHHGDYCGPQWHVECGPHRRQLWLRQPLLARRLSRRLHQVAPVDRQGAARVCQCQVCPAAAAVLCHGVHRHHPCAL